jgi:hypothetical protein
VSQAGRASQDHAPEPERGEQGGSGAQPEPMAESAPPQNVVTDATERPLEYQENLVNLDDPSALGDVTRWAVRTIEEQEPDDPRGSWIAQWILARDNAEFPLNDDVDGRLETLMGDFQHTRYHGDARDAAEWNSTLISAFMTKFAGNLRLEPRNAVEPAQPPGDVPSSYGSTAQPELSERVVAWDGRPERFVLDSLYPWSETSESSAESYQKKNERQARRLFRSNVTARDYGYTREQDVFVQTQNKLRERREEAEARIREERGTDQSKGPLSQER